MEGDAILDSNRRFTDAAATRDARAMASVYADDAELLPPNTEPLRGQEAIERFWRAGIEMGIRSIVLETVRLEYADCLRLAYEVGRYTLQIDANGGAPEVDVGKYVIIHRHTPDRNWLRAVEIFNSNAPIA